MDNRRFVRAKQAWGAAMALADETGRATAEMTAPEMLRHLLLRAFPQSCIVTASLRARGVVALHMIAEIDRATPVLFCHASYLYPESVDYRARIVELLGLTDVRDPLPDESEPLPGDSDHWEQVPSSTLGDATAWSPLHLNQSLAGFECWISAAYHRPYADDSTSKVVQEGRLVRVDPLKGWTRDRVDAYLEDNDLPRHPRIAAPTYHY
jgi:phosphoadenosine phosphosulfate reductase